jgi:hypothetical protein
MQLYMRTLAWVDRMAMVVGLLFLMRVECLTSAKGLFLNGPNSGSVIFSVLRM